MRSFNTNELAMARNIAVAVNVTLSTMLKQLNARYGVQQWEDRIPTQYRVDGVVVNQSVLVQRSLELAANERMAPKKVRKVRSDKGKPRQGRTFVLTAEQSAEYGL